MAVKAQRSLLSGKTLDAARPGYILQEEFLKPLKITHRELARHLGWSTGQIHAIVEGRAVVTANMALKLSMVFGTSPELWLNAQNAVDLAKAASRLKKVPAPLSEGHKLPTLQLEKAHGSQQEGPASYMNWIAQSSHLRALSGHECALFTDALIGESNRKYGPYELINTGAFVSPKGDGVRPAIVLRLDVHREFQVPAMNKTDTERYHGGSLVDEIAALTSLAMGIRLKAGPITRDFDGNTVDSDPRGTPVAYIADGDPVLPRGGSGPVLPWARGSHLLGESEPIRTYERLSASKANALVRAARLYQEAMWIAESQPALSWLMLVSSVECAANHWKTSEDPPLDRLRQSRPDLVDYLEGTGIPDLPLKVADSVANSIGATKKFVDFLLAFMPEPPAKRPAPWASVEWTPQYLRKAFQTIYGHRSKALHSGIPFPSPLHDYLLRMKDWEAPAEKPVSVAASSGGGVWLQKDLPMMIHVFEYIARRALNTWWTSNDAINADKRK